MNTFIAATNTHLLAKAIKRASQVHFKTWQTNLAIINSSLVFMTRTVTWLVPVEIIALFFIFFVSSSSIPKN